MADIVDRLTRSRMMSRVRGKDTRPEWLVRRLLHSSGFRYRLHARGLPGKPDLVLRKYGAVVLVHGCFWHGHDCHLFRMPATSTEFWAEKIAGNRVRDERTDRLLREAGWRRLVVWECALKGRTRLPETELREGLVSWLRSDLPDGEIAGC